MDDASGTQRAFETSRSGRARSLDALHEVERFAAAPGPTRADAWRDDLLEALSELAASLHDQHVGSTSKGSILDRIATEAPHLLPAVGELVDRQSAIEESIMDLTRYLADLSRPVDVDRTRAVLAEITREIRELRAWETDLVYEAYSVDLGVGD